MRVSVVIPVYNAEAFVREAVISCLSQPETAEVILIEDGSDDGSLRVCRALQKRFPKVVLLRHRDGANRGAGASRNAGIEHARSPYIAFLDADDFFLPDRFSVAKQVLEANPDADGVYEAVGVHFETEAARQRWQQRGGKELTAMTKRVPPERLFEEQAPIGSSGYCPTGGWVVRRSAFDKAGLFDDHLRLHQDTAMYVKFAAVCTMLPGRLDTPVAMRRVHDSNRISAPRSPIDRYRDRLLMWATLWEWGRDKLSRTRYQLLVKRFIAHAIAPSRKASSLAANMAQSARQLTSLVTRYPALLRDPVFWRSLGTLAATFVVHGDLSSH